ncbi:unnamed protein product [Tenebrio molitor]|nr:unnamed protein product [Tenebrio molitor]
MSKHKKLISVKVDRQKLSLISRHLQGMSSFELPVSKIRVELSILTFAFRQVYCLQVFTLEQKTF